MTRFVIIGGGIIGTSIARELARRKAGSITVLEKEVRAGCHASGRNSGVIHSGINQKPGSMKARMCVAGSRMLREYCREKNVPMRECGTLVVASTEKEEETLQTLLTMGEACGVEGLRMLSAKELQERESNALGKTALLSPSGATVDAPALVESLALEAQSGGVEFLFSRKALKVREGCIETGRETVEADFIINCAGLYADRIAHQMGAGKGYHIVPFRGEYLEVEGCEVRSMIYQAPDLRFPFLSVHLTRETDGRVLAGPTACLAFGREAYHKQWHPGDMADMMTRAAFWRLISSPEFLTVASANALMSLSRHAFVREVRKVARGIEASRVKPFRSGIRAQMINAKGRFVNDILVERQEKAFHVLNAVSPGMTCSLAFAEYVTDRILEERAL